MIDATVTGASGALVELMESPFDWGPDAQPEAVQQLIYALGGTRRPSAPDELNLYLIALALRSESTNG